MKRIYPLMAACLLAPVLAAATTAEEAQQMDLPKPRIEGGKPLLDALKHR